MDDIEIKSKIDDNVFNYYSINKNSRIIRKNPNFLLTPKRLDIIARYIYIFHRQSGKGFGWGNYVYRNLLSSWCPTFVDGDGKKFSYSDYICLFGSLIDDMEKNGYNSQLGLIPYVGDTNIDGAHRLACCLYFNYDFDAVELSGKEQIQDAKTLLKIGMDKTVVYDMVCQYIRLDHNTYSAIFFPSPLKDFQNALNKLYERVEIIIEKEITLTDNGKNNIIHLLWGHEPYWKDDLTKTFVNLRFPAGSSIHVVFFKIKNDEDPRSIKKYVRESFHGKDHQVHMNDTHKETCWISDVLLNDNGICYMNSASMKVTPNFNSLFSVYREEILSLPEGRRDEFCLDSGAVLSFFGIRDCNDIDYIVNEPKFSINSNYDLSIHNDEYREFFIPIDELIYNPKFYFKYKGIKVMSLNMVSLFKSWRGTEKDKIDCKLINENINFCNECVRCQHRCVKESLENRSILTKKFKKINKNPVFKPLFFKFKEGIIILFNNYLPISVRTGIKWIIYALK